MQIIVKAKPRAKIEKVELLSQSPLNFEDKLTEIDIYRVSIKEPPINGKANVVIIKALAKYFSKPTSNIILISGAKSRQKSFEIV